MERETSGRDWGVSHKDELVEVFEGTWRATSRSITTRTPPLASSQDPKYRTLFLGTALPVPWYGSDGVSLEEKTSQVGCGLFGCA